MNGIISFRLLACVAFFQAFHPDGDVKLESGRIWIEPMAANDVLLYQPNPLAPNNLFVNFDPDAKSWSIDGLADVDAYSTLLQVMFTTPSCCICSSPQLGFGV